MSPQTTQRTAPVIFSPSWICLILIHLAVECVGSVCGTVAEGDSPYVCASSRCHFAHKQQISRAGMFTAAILFDVYVLCWCFVIHFLTSLGLHLCLCHSSPHSHPSPVYISQLQTQKIKARPDWWQRPWQPVGLTLWEATANLSLLVYLLNATLHELRQQKKRQMSLCVGGRNAPAPSVYNRDSTSWNMYRKNLTFWFKTKEKFVQQWKTLHLVIHNNMHYVSNTI